MVLLRVLRRYRRLTGTSRRPWEVSDVITIMMGSDEEVNIPHVVRPRLQRYLQVAHPVPSSLPCGFLAVLDRDGFVLGVFVRGGRLYVYGSSICSSDTAYLDDNTHASKLP